MCVALPTGSRSQARPSRLPEFLRVAVGAVVLFSILAVCLLFERLLPRGH